MAKTPVKGKPTDEGIRIVEVSSRLSYRRAPQLSSIRAFGIASSRGSDSLVVEGYISRHWTM